MSHAHEPGSRRSDSNHTRRSTAAVAGVVLLMCATGLQLAGFGSPHWSRAERPRGHGVASSSDDDESSSSSSSSSSSGVVYTYHDGVWQVCVSALLSPTSSPSLTASGCSGYRTQGEGRFPFFVPIMRLLLCGCTVGLAMACVLALVNSHTPSSPSSSSPSSSSSSSPSSSSSSSSSPSSSSSSPGHRPQRRSSVVEFLAVFAGLLGLAGCLMYADMKSSPGNVLSRNLDWTFSWAFYLTALGCLLSVLAGVLLALSNHNDNDKDNDNDHNHDNDHDHDDAQARPRKPRAGWRTSSATPDDERRDVLLKASTQ